MSRSLPFKVATWLLCGGALTVVVVPLGLYWFGLSNIDGRPVPSARTDNLAADTALLRQDFRNHLPIVVHVLNPWAFIGQLRAEKAATPDNGVHAVWSIVRNYNGGHLRNHKMIWWHISGAALTIWVTRNWTSDEVVSAAAAIVRSYPRRPSAG
jgi:hypothetical protein